MQSNGATLREAIDHPMLEAKLQATMRIPASAGNFEPRGVKKYLPYFDT
jgi:hypothetical protein